MSIQQSVNQIASNLQWASSFYSQSPSAKAKYEAKQANKRLEQLNKATSPATVEKEYLEAYRKDYPDSTESDNEIIRKQRTTMEADAKKRLKMYEDATYEHYLKYPTGENYLNYKQAKYAREAGVGFGGQQYRSPEYNNPYGPINENVIEPQFSREQVLDGVGAEMINKIKQTETFAGFREGLKNQELMKKWRVGKPEDVKKALEGVNN